MCNFVVALVACHLPRSVIGMGLARIVGDVAGEDEDLTQLSVVEALRRWEDAK